MAEWKGVPYFFDVSSGVMDQLFVSVDKLPKVVVETSFSWETIIGSLLAAALPSFIAWYALTQNYKLAEYQHDLMHKKELVYDIRASVSEYVTNIALLIHTLSMMQTNSKFNDGEFSEYYNLDLNETLINNAEKYELNAELNKNKIILLLDELDDKNKIFFNYLIQINNLTEVMKGKYLTTEKLEIDKVQQNINKIIVEAKIITLDILQKNG